MSHPTERQLVEFVTRRLDPKDAGGLTLHLAGCSGCRIRAERLAALYPVLGAWEAPPPPRDFEHAILAAVDEEQRTHLRWREYARVAAAVILALGLGHVAARSFRATSTLPPPADATTAAQTLGLDALAGGDSGDLDIVLQLAQAEGAPR